MVRVRAWMDSAPARQDGYVAGQRMRVIAEFDRHVSIAGLPRLGIEIGETTRYADFSPFVEDDWPPDRPSLKQRFDYVVRAEDRDSDGVRIAANAFDLSDGAFLDSGGVRVNPVIYAVAPEFGQFGDPGQSLQSHRVLGFLPTPAVQARVSVISVPSPYSGSYPEGEWIRLLTELAEPLRVMGSPRVAIDIGGTTRYADFSPWVAHRISDPEHKRQSQVKRGFEEAPRFDYLVRADDLDSNGFSIASDGFDFTEGAFLNDAGVNVEVEITSVMSSEFGDEMEEPSLDLGSHPVIGRPQPRMCTDEQDLALAFGSVLVEEWDGHPFQFYYNVVGLSERELGRAQHFLDVVEKLSRRIEDQIGYSVLEVGGWMEDPRVGSSETCDWRLPGQIVGFVTRESDWKGGWARPECALWGGFGDYLLNIYDGSASHEIFHNFGFTHHPGGWQFPGTYGFGVFMSHRLSGAYVDRADLALSFEDVDALRCIFPKGG